MSTSGGSSGGAILIATAHLTNTAINTLHSVPVQLVADPGANQAIEVTSWTLEAVPGAVGNWNASSQTGLFYGSTITGPNQLTQSFTLPDMLAAAALPNAAQIYPANPLAIGAYASTVIAHKALNFACQASDPTKIGGLTAIAVNNGGAGYAINDTGTIDVDFYGGGAAYKVLTVGGGGTVLTVQLTAAGTGYDAPETNNSTTAGGGQPGLGTGLTVDFVSVTQPQGDLYVTVGYRLIATH